MENQTFDITGLPLTEVNKILEALSERPFKDVYLLLNLVRGQVEEQIKANEAPTETVPRPNLITEPAPYPTEG